MCVDGSCKHIHNMFALSAMFFVIIFEVVLGDCE